MGDNKASDVNYKKKYIVENTDLLDRAKKVSIIRIINNEYSHLIQECGEGSNILLDSIDDDTINYIYNIVKSTMDK